jgi:hypothetical protein
MKEASRNRLRKKQRTILFRFMCFRLQESLQTNLFKRSLLRQNTHWPGLFSLVVLYGCNFES